MEGVVPGGKVGNGKLRREVPRPVVRQGHAVVGAQDGGGDGQAVHGGELSPVGHGRAGLHRDMVHALQEHIGPEVVVLAVLVGAGGEGHAVTHSVYKGIGLVVGGVEVGTSHRLQAHPDAVLPGIFRPEGQNLDGSGVALDAVVLGAGGFLIGVLGRRGFVVRPPGRPDHQGVLVEEGGGRAVGHPDGEFGLAAVVQGVCRGVIHVGQPQVGLEHRQLPGDLGLHHRRVHHGAVRVGGDGDRMAAVGHHPLGKDLPGLAGLEHHVALHGPVQMLALQGLAVHLEGDGEGHGDVDGAAHPDGEAQGGALRRVCGVGRLDNNVAEGELGHRNGKFLRGDGGAVVALVAVHQLAAGGEGDGVHPRRGGNGEGLHGAGPLGPEHLPLGGHLPVHIEGQGEGGIGLAVVCHRGRPDHLVLGGKGGGHFGDIQVCPGQVGNGDVGKVHLLGVILHGQDIVGHVRLGDDLENVVGHHLEHLGARLGGVVEGDGLGRPRLQAGEGLVA